MTSAEFWTAAGTIGASDAEYCKSHRLAPGMLSLLARLRSAGVRLACLSNDVAEWSLLLREWFGLASYITDWVISGEIGVRKPSPAAYAALIERLYLPAERILFVDDRLENVVAARAAGLQTLQYDDSTIAELGLRFT
jgi:HAD superfamily hydrolase (TIGR01509 family)